MRRPQLQALTGLRFFAAAHVVVYHYGRRLGWHAGPWSRVLDHGFVGVTLFFVLSGFILVYSQGAGERPGGAREFWAARFARIYPVYLVGLLLATPALFFPQGSPHRAPDPLALTTAPLLLQAWLPHSAGVWNGPAWSLSAEALFYALFPALAFGILRLTRRGALATAAAAWAASLGIVLAYVLIRPDGAVRPGMPTATAPWLECLRYLPLARLPEFVLGMAVGRLYLLRSDLLLSPGDRRRFDTFALLALLASLAIVASPVALPYPMLHGGFLGPFFALAFYALARANGGGLLSACVGNRLVVRLGEASYALYILHVPIHDLLERALAALGRHPGAVVFFSMYLATAIAASAVVYSTFELPARRRLRAWLGHRRAHEPAPNALRDRADAQAAA